MKELIAAAMVAICFVLAVPSAAEPDYRAEIGLHVIDPCLMSSAVRAARTIPGIPLEQAFRLVAVLNRIHVERVTENTLPMVRGLSRDARLAIYDFARNRCITGASHPGQRLGTPLPRRPRQRERRSGSARSIVQVRQPPADHIAPPGNIHRRAVGAEAPT